MFLIVLVPCFIYWSFHFVICLAFLQGTMFVPGIYRITNSCLGDFICSFIYWPFVSTLSSLHILINVNAFHLVMLLIISYIMLEIALKFSFKNHVVVNYEVLVAFMRGSVIFENSLMGNYSR